MVGTAPNASPKTDSREGDTWEQMSDNVLEATAAFFFDRPRPRSDSPPPCPRRDPVRRM